MEKKTERIKFWLTDKELKQIDRKAGKLGMNRSEYIRYLKQRVQARAGLRESLFITALSDMWKYRRYLKDSTSKQTPEKALQWSISPSRCRHNKRAGIPPAHT